MCVCVCVCVCARALLYVYLSVFTVLCFVSALFTLYLHRNFYCKSSCRGIFAMQ